ncbi:hypothetical protein ACOSP7_007111 [Xanthoceras sorbifolium]
MVMTGDDDVTLAKGLCIFRDIFNMGPSPCKEVAGINGSLKSLQKSPKIKKASYVKQGPKGIRCDPCHGVWDTWAGVC